jgi:hypothetical protein
MNARDIAAGFVSGVALLAAAAMLAGLAQLIITT